MGPDVLLLFLKPPRPGEVKTRLLGALGADTAAALYRALAEETVRRTAPEQGEYQRLFFFTPAGARSEVETWMPAAAWVEQRGADLGARMAGAFAEAFGRGAGRAVIVGSDVPGLSRSHVHQAFRALEAHDLVLGPARDGGYYLLGLDRLYPELFEGIAWSTREVLAQTLDRARALGLRVHRLEELADVDTPDDLRREWARVRPLLSARPELQRALLDALGESPPLR